MPQTKTSKTLTTIGERALDYIADPPASRRIVPTRAKTRRASPNG